MARSILSLFLISASCACFAAAYKVKVETYVGGKLEDKFVFVIKEGAPQEKGFDGKYLAKRYLARGFENPALASLDEIKKASQLAQQEADKTYLQKAEDLIVKYKSSLAYIEKSTEDMSSRAERLKARLETLEEIVKLGNNAVSKAKYEQYMQKYAPTKQETADAKKTEAFRRIKYVDYEEYNVGSFCRMEIQKVFSQNVVGFEISYAYSRLLATAYHDGINTDNAITKYPIFEMFERLNTKAKITLGRPYCIQMARPKSIEEAKTIQDAMSKTQLFSASGGKPADVGGGAEAAAEKKSPLDVKGSYEKIKNAFSADASQTLRAVFTVTAVK